VPFAPTGIPGLFPAVFLDCSRIVRLKNRYCGVGLHHACPSSSYVSKSRGIGMSTPEARLRSICDLFRKAIEDLRKEIPRKEKQESALESRISQLQSQPNPDTAQIQLLQEQLAGLKNQLETDRAQLNAFEEEFSASCN
jgi:septal ring factor EnvC (AmiA/AmiB activator)